MSIAVALLFLSGGLQWKEIFHIDGELDGAEFGTAVCVLGDVNGDGVSDLAVAAPRTGAPFLSVHSGVDGSRVWTLDGVLFEDELGKSLAIAGDVNADGYPDLLAAYPTDCGATDSHFNRAWVLSGRDGVKLLEILGSQTTRDGFASAVAPAGDLDGDAIPDLWIGAEFTEPRLGRVTAFSGRDGHEIRHLEGPEKPWFGQGMLAMGDLDADGIGDLAVTSWNQLFFVSGRSAQILRTVNITANRGSGSLARLDDLDGDGAPEVVVRGGELVVIVSSSSGHVLHRWEGGSWGNAVIGVPDIDGDGQPEVAIGIRAKEDRGMREDRGAVDVRSVRSGEVLLELCGSRYGGHFGFALAAGDLDGDGSTELVVGEPGTGRNGFGIVHVFTLTGQ